MDLNFLNEPVSRQAVLSGGAAVIGFLTTVTKEAYGLRVLHPNHLFRIADDPSYRMGGNFPTNAITIGTASLGTALGLEESIRNLTPILGSYTLETVSDLGATIIGYYAGRALPFISYWALTSRRSNS